MSKLTETFESGQVLTASSMNGIVSAVNDTYDLVEQEIGQFGYEEDGTKRTAASSLAGISQELGNLRTAVAALKNGMVIVEQTATSGLNLASGTTSIWVDAIGSLSFNLLAPSDGTEAHYRLRFSVLDGFAIDAPTLEGEMPEWATDKTYEMDIVTARGTNYAIVKEW